MTKKETSKIQLKLQELGERFGLISDINKPLRGREHHGYAPEYDVVWYLDMKEHFNLEAIRKLFKHDQGLFERIQLLPFAGFEIEGSSTTSKNQLGNLSNLYSGSFIYSFLIVNNEEASVENDTYRRGVKLKRYFSSNSGDRNLFFFDRVHLTRSIETLSRSNSDNEIPVGSSKAGKRQTFGGETTSVKLYEKIRPLLGKTGLEVKHNYAPWLSKVKYQMAKEASVGNDFTDFYIGQAFYKNPSDTFTTKVKRAKSQSESLYIPNIDICLGFNAPKGFTAWLSALANTLGLDIAHFPTLYALNKPSHKNKPLFIPLIGVELETTINKHLSGGAYNLAKNTYAGVVVTNQPALKHIEFYKKEFGLKNVTAYNLEE